MASPALQPMTGQQRLAYDFILDYAKRNGRHPSVREIGTALGLASPNNANRVVRQLVDAGILAPDPAPAKGPSRSLDAVPLAHTLGSSQRFALPILGTVAAGPPLEILDPNDDSFDFTSAFGGGDKFLVRVRGDSMIERHIAPGDLVVVRRADTAEHGDEVVARIGGGLTLKVYQESRRGKFAGKWLFPANSALSPVRIDTAADVAIVGIVEGVIRHSKAKKRPRCI